MSLYLGNDLYNTNSGVLFRDLGLITKAETRYEETRIPSIVNVEQNIPQDDPTLNKWFNYKRSGAEKFADPFPNKSRPLQWKWDGRKLAMTNTLKVNQKPNFPDVITAYPQQVVGKY